jgi:hypothetical protein
MNMFKPTKAKTSEEYIELLPEERKKDLLLLDRLIKKTVPQLKRHFAYNMLGYGSFPYLNYKKQTVPWPVVALASQKNYISLYVCALEKGKYIAEKYKADLGKVSVGKSCIRFKKFEDLNVKGLEKVLKLAQKMPGLVSASQK